MVSSALQKYKINAVLSGGAVVSIYTQNEYLSGDLDFITHENLKTIDQAMLSIGFNRQGRHYIHPKIEFFIEFPSPPLAIGDYLIKNWATKKTPMGTIQLLTPTQCIMDRLAAFYFWNDLQCLDQALMVAAKQSIHISDIEKWSQHEGMLEKFLIFNSKLLKLKKKT